MASNKQPKVKKKNKETIDNYQIFNITVRVTQSLFLVFISFLLLLAALGTGIGIGYFAFLVEDTKIPSKVELQQDLGDITQTSKLVYANGNTISNIRSDLRRTNVASNQISPLLKKAVVATEDEYFYKHHGVVPKAVVRALLSEAIGGGGGGGSTLTQQLVKQQILSSETTFKRKANEILLALEVEKNFSKDEIITMYLNVSPFGRNNHGQNIAGVQEAAMGIFGKNASDLNLPQAAFIAGLPQSPIIYSPYTNDGQLKNDFTYGLKRKNVVLFSMYRNHDITKKEYEEAKNYDITKDFLPPSQAQNTSYGYLYDTVMSQAIDIIVNQLATKDGLTESQLADDDVYNEYARTAKDTLANGGYTIQTTIDEGIYQAMQQAVNDYGSYLDTNYNDPVEVGNVLMDNATGRILGFVGGRNYNQNQFNHAFDAKRQAGSAIKPVLVYGPAIDLGLMGSESRVSDYATSWKTGDDAGKEIVNATNKGSNTFQTVRESLNWSNNIPAYNIYQEVLNETGDKNFVYNNYLSKMNYPASDIWQYESAPLGVATLSVVSQTNGFQTLANHGIYQQGYLIEAITNSKGKKIYKHKQNPVRVFSEASASIMNDLMRSVLQAQITTSYKTDLSSLNASLANLDWVGKTGSTNDWADSWLVVSTPKVTISSWSGYEDNRPSDSNAGRRTSLYLANLVNRIYQVSPEVFGTNEKFTLADSVKKEKVSKFTGQKNQGTVKIGNTEWKSFGEETTSLWAKNGPVDTSFRFGIGGTDENYQDYWKKLTPAKKEENNKDKESKEKTEKENKDENANQEDSEQEEKNEDKKTD